MMKRKRSSGIMCAEEVCGEKDTVDSKEETEPSSQLVFCDLEDLS